MSNNEQLWQSALTEIELSVSKPTFNTWFKNTFIQKEDSGTIYLCVPNAFVRDWLSTKYHTCILRAIRNELPQARGVEYVISKQPVEQKEIPQKVEVPTMNDQLGLGNLEIDRSDGLNPRYTFDSFIVGSFNELAHAAAQGVIKNPGMHYNPLFIYGGTGFGKTHLLQAIGNQVKKLNRNKKIYYLTSEQFTLDYLDSIQNNKAHQFKEKYRKYDFLIMDDIQFVSGKEKTQEELFHLFNSLHENNKQIIFSSDRAPKVLDKLEDRLRSRFEGGMIVDISQPDYESRLAILRTKVATSAFIPSDEIIEFTASVIQDSIRELEGVLNSIICQSQLKKRNLSIPEVKQLIKTNIRPQKSVSIKDVIKTVASFYNVEERLLFEKSRRKEVVKPRQIVMYILREDLSTSYPYIGRKLGGRDHTTVIHACEKIKKDLQGNSVLSQELDQIKNLLYQDNQRMFYTNV